MTNILSSIRRATENDIEEVYSLICTLEEGSIRKEAFDSIYLTNLKQPSIEYFVAQINNFIVGFASIYINELLHHGGKVGEIQELIVADTSRRNHIGTALVDSVSAWAISKGALQIEVTCNTKRSGAIDFYKRCGFVHTHHKLVLIP